MPRRLRRVLDARLRTQFEVVRSFGRPPEDDLDVFYALQRMRKWLPQGPANEPVRGALPAYLEPVLVQHLLAIPSARRLSGEFFDEALAEAYPPFVPRGQPVLTRRRGVIPMIGHLRGAMNISRPRARGPIPGAEGPIAEAMIRGALANWSFTRSLLGPRWFQAELNRTKRTGNLRTLWNALSIDAFAAFLERLPG
jgi:hypothetical protein